MAESLRARAWRAQAVNDAAHARYSMEGGFHAQACYAAQQAVEKALKALLLHTGREASHTHSIVGLRRALEEAGVEVPESVLSLAEAQDLTRLNIETRYPLGGAEEAPFELFGSEQAQRMVGVAGRVVTMIEGVLG
ncbi:MAG: HEPN domain-containing protein [Pseudomonadota bacterium]|nr:HEPN domain-containing protein [Pseudomonadota bacterium]